MKSLTTVRLLRNELKSDPKLAPALAEAKKLALRAFAWMLLGEGFLVGQIYPVKAFFDGLSVSTIDRMHLLHIVAIMAALYCAASLVMRSMDNRRADFYWRMWSLLWGYGHRVEQRQSVDWHVAHSTGEKESIMTKNINRVDILIDEFVFETIPTVLRIIFTTIGVWIFIGPRYGALSAITTVIFVLVVVLTNGFLKKNRKVARSQGKFLERYGTEMTANWRTLKYFGAEETRCETNQHFLDQFYRDEGPRFRTLTWTLTAQQTVITFSRVALYALVALSFQGRSLGIAVLATAWMERIYTNFYRVSNFQRRLNESWESVKELVELVLTVPSVRQPSDPIWPSKLDGRVELKNVGFTHPGNDKPALAEINLVVEPNQTIALAGKSGCGKTTLAELLMRSYDPCTGSIELDGHPLSELDYDRYRREVVSIVNQDVQLFDMSVRDNIRLSRPESSDEDVVAAAVQAYAHEFIMAFPEGYDTLVGEDGIRLSGGQKQRIAIARALLRKPRVLVLDEATSALDAESQHYVKRAIDRLIADRVCTIFVIAHRLSTIKEADWVVVLDDGKVAEIGTHQELARGNGFYRRMCELESQGILTEA